MLQSMTGFGRSASDVNGKSIAVELRSLNSRGIEISFRMPAFLREKEFELRNELAKMLERGKVDVIVSWVGMEEKQELKINKPLFLSYYEELKSIAESLGEKPIGLMEAILRMPDVNQSAAPATEVEHLPEFRKLFSESLALLVKFRETEGAVLKSDLLDRCREIETQLHEIEKSDPQRREKVRARLESALKVLKESEKLDPNRLEQELIYYIEKLDISEEKIRLKSHLRLFQETLEESAPGRKINFICQEIGREINTIGSKANDATIQQRVVRMKDELEKMKEQALNVL